MAVCASCSATNPDTAAFCEACGTPSLSVASVPEAVPIEYLPGEAPSTQVSTTPSPAGASESAPATTCATTYAMTSATEGVAAPVRPCVTCGGRVEDTYCTVCGVLQPSERDHFEEQPAPWVAGVCDKGIVHARNEDAMANAVNGDVAVLVVCDGVTTAPLSERASLAAARAACKSLLAASGSAPPETINWDDAIQAACVLGQGEAVAVARTLGDPPEPPSCTFVAAVVHNARRSVTVGWCGDSRAYWLPDGSDGLILSIDDSIASQMIAAGTPRATAEADHRAHTITRWLGADSPDPTARTATFPLESAGWVLAVSDGLWNYASEPKAIRALINGISVDGISVDGTMTTPTPHHVATTLVRFANEQGGSDNITVAAARIEES
jgi:serine/threonine protein phosphatase PrpC